MSRPVLSYFRNIPIVASGTKPIRAGRWCAVPIPKGLMPYEAAAKAIFIRANGAPAYYRATGIVRDPERASDHDARQPNHSCPAVSDV